MPGGQIARHSAFEVTTVAVYDIAPRRHRPGREAAHDQVAAADLSDIVVGPLMFPEMFGSIFLLSEELPTVCGYSAREARMPTPPWTAMPVTAGPTAGALSDRIGGGSVIAAGKAPGTGRRPSSRCHAPLSCRRCPPHPTSSTACCVP